MHRSLTVNEVLIYQANLRLPSTISNTEKKRRIHEVNIQIKRLLTVLNVHGQNVDFQKSSSSCLFITRQTSCDLVALSAASRPKIPQFASLAQLCYPKTQVVDLYQVWVTTLFSPEWWQARSGRGLGSTLIMELGQTVSYEEQFLFFNKYGFFSSTGFGSSRSQRRQEYNDRR